MQTKTRNLLVRYTIVYILAVAAVQIAGMLLARFMPDIGSPSGLAFVPSIIAAMDAGQSYFKSNGTRPENVYSWKVAVLFSAISFLVSMLIVVLLDALDFPVVEMMNQAGPKVLAVALALFFVLHIVISRLMFGSGAKTASKSVRK